MNYLLELYRKLLNIAYGAAPFLLGLTIAAITIGGCSLEEKGRSSDLRAHDDLIQGVSHARSSLNGPRYCKSCHGLGLQGGTNGEPSCFQCHGENWNPIDSETSRGDANHTINNGGYFHHTGLTSPTTNCVACHGANLTGDESRSGNPSCFLCHEQKW